MKMIKKVVALAMVIALLGSMVVTAVFSSSDKGENGAFKMENMPGPIDDVIFEQVSEDTYSVEIILDNGDIITFDMEVNMAEQSDSHIIGTSL